MKTNKILYITESEKKSIRKMYGLILEQTDEEILNYIDKYIDNHSCDEIAEDMKKIKNTDTYKNLSEEDKKNFDNGIVGLENPGAACLTLGLEYNVFNKKSYHCKILKKYMKGKFEEELPIRKDLIISQICAFSYLWTEEPAPIWCNKKTDKDVSSSSEPNTNQNIKTTTTITATTKTQTPTTQTQTTQNPTNQNKPDKTTTKFVNPKIEPGYDDDVSKF